MHEKKNTPLPLRAVAAMAIVLTPLAPAGAATAKDVALFSKKDAASWKPVDGSAPATVSADRTPGGRPALRFRCNMPDVKDRAYWDHDVRLDLAAVTRIAFWARASGDGGAISHATLYFKSGAGWYGAPIDAGFGSWQRVVLSRDKFRVEGNPAGWRAIERIRIAFWKGRDREAVVRLGGLEVYSPLVVVVCNRRFGKEAEQVTAAMMRLLARAGIEAAQVDDADVESGALAGRRLAVYPHNPRLSAAELDRLEAFVREGGRLVACYSVPPRLRKLLSVASDGYLRRERPGQFASIRLEPGTLEDSPRAVLQDSWNIYRMRPQGEKARTIARWYDAEGKDTGYAAVILGPAGAYVSHVVLEDDPERKSRFLRSLLGRLCPALWNELLRAALERCGVVSTWKGFEEACAGLGALAAGNGRAGAVRKPLAEARRLHAEARQAADARRFARAIELLSRAKDRLLDTYARALTPRRGEFRAVWCHSARGVQGISWDAAVRRLKDSGFNAVVPNMLWGGVADYRSKVLPVRASVATQGDAIAECLAACKKYGVELHVWKVNWNLGRAPKSFVERMRKEGRLQAASDGSETRWLCPSDPRNFALERDSMLEVARNYDVDGIHFDYIRYPGAANCFCKGCRKRFEELSGSRVASWPRDVLRGGRRHDAYQDFRRSNITRLVKAVSLQAHRMKPWIQVSAAVFSDWPSCRDHVAQDWVRWARDGYLDFVCPMNYTASNATFRGRIEIQREALGGCIPLYSGIGASAPGLHLDQVLDQVRIARGEGADGFIVFNYAGEVAGRHVPALGLGAASRAATPPHDMPAIEWKLSQDGKVLRGPARADRPVKIEAAATCRGRMRVAPTSVSVSVAVCKAGGKPVRELGRCRSGESPLSSELQLPPGAYRPVAQGRMTLPGGATRDFLSRGPYLELVEQGARKAP